MRNSQAKKQENRRLILDAAGRLFRERGIDNVSVADVMQAAGMTHGGFYRHFADKDDLVASAVTQILDDRANATSDTPADLPAFVDLYLSAEHRDDRATGCVFAALGSEAARAPAAARRALTQSIQRQIDDFAGSAAGRSAKEKRRTAIATRAALLGAVLLARISDDPALAREILDETRAWLKAGPARRSPAAP